MCVHIGVNQTATNVFVLCLAISDLALCIFSLPVQLHYQLTNRWYFGSVLCRIVFAAFAVPMYLSTVTILLIAVDRYLLVVRPFSARLSACSALGLVAVNVAVSTLLAAPVVHNTSLHVVDHEPDLGIDHMQLCVELWTSADLRRAYSISTFLLQFCLPLILTAALYARIYARLRLRRRRPIGSGATGIRPTAAVSDCCRASVVGGSPNSCPTCFRGRSDEEGGAETGLQQPKTSDNDDTGCSAKAAATMVLATPAGDGVTYVGNGSARRRRAEKTNRILAAIVVNFVVCWLPWNVFGLVTELDSRLVSGRHFKLVDLTLKGFAMSSACINPLLYCWLNESLRRDLGAVAVRLRLYRRTPANDEPATNVPAGVSRVRSPLPARLGLMKMANSPAAGRHQHHHQSQHQQRQGRTARGLGVAPDLPRFDVQPPSFCADGVSAEGYGHESSSVVGATGGAGGVARLAVTGGRLVVEPWPPRPMTSCYLSSVSSAPGTVSVTFERSSISSGGGSGHQSDASGGDRSANDLSCESAL